MSVDGVDRTDDVVDGKQQATGQEVTNGQVINNEVWEPEGRTQKT
jgi:hypothetical protein